MLSLGSMEKKDDNVSCITFLQNQVYFRVLSILHQYNSKEGTM